MAEKLSWKVKRRHMGDRFYEVGDTREATFAEVKHLVGTVLEDDPQPVSEKAESAPLNKAEVAAPANKAATGRKGKNA